MRSLTYSAIVGATFIFIAIVATLLWNYIYNSWSVKIIKQATIFYYYPKLLSFNLSQIVFSLRNISNVTVDLNLYGLQYIEFYPKIQEKIKNETARLKLHFSKFYFNDQNVWIEVGKYTNWTMNTNLLKLTGRNIYRIYVLYLGLFPKIPVKLFKSGLNETNFSLKRVELLKQHSLGFLGDQLLKELKKEYEVSYQGSDKYFRIELNPEICDKIRTLQGVVVSGDKFASSGTVVVVKFNFTRFSNFSKELNDPEKCRKFLKTTLRKIIVNFSYSFNYNNLSEIIFPLNATLNWSLVSTQEDYVLCTLDKKLIAYPKWLSKDVAEKICSDVNKLTLQRIESSEAYKHLFSLPQQFTCSTSGGPFSRLKNCFSVCANALGTIISNALTGFYSMLKSIFGGGGGPVEQLQGCLRSCTDEAAKMACSACCRGSSADLQRAENYYSSCAASCIEKFKDSVAAIKVQLQTYSPAINITFRVIDTKLLVNSYPPNLTDWWLMSFKVSKSYQL